MPSTRKAKSGAGSKEAPRLRANSQGVSKERREQNRNAKKRHMLKTKNHQEKLERDCQQYEEEMLTAFESNAQLREELTTMLDEGVGTQTAQLIRSELAKGPTIPEGYQLSTRSPSPVSFDPSTASLSDCARFRTVVQIPDQLDMVFEPGQKDWTRVADDEEFERLKKEYFQKKRLSRRLIRNPEAPMYKRIKGSTASATASVLSTAIDQSLAEVTSVRPETTVSGSRAAPLSTSSPIPDGSQKASRNTASYVDTTQQSHTSPEELHTTSPPQSTGLPTQESFASQPRPIQQLSYCTDYSAPPPEQWWVEPTSPLPMQPHSQAATNPWSNISYAPTGSYSFGEMSGVPSSAAQPSLRSWVRELADDYETEADQS